MKSPINTQQTFPVQTLKQLQSFAIDLVNKMELPTAILMSGQMGCGKTQLTQFIVSALEDHYTLNNKQKVQVTSPTFTLRNTYVVNNMCVEHFDLFRLKNHADLESTGLWEVFQQKQVVLIVEWADFLGKWNVVPSHLKKTWHVVNIQFSNHRYLTPCC